MTPFKKTAMLALLAGLGFTGTSHASLLARAGGMVYDDVSNITWAADANLFKTQADSNPNLVNEIIVANNGVILGFPYGQSNGIYDLSDSWDFHVSAGTMTWFGAQAWVGYLNATKYDGYSNWRLPITPKEAMSLGWNITGSELGNLYYNNLGGEAFKEIVSTHNDNYNLFSNIQTIYWSGTTGSAGFIFGFNGGPGGFSGWQMIADKSNQTSAWAVRSGDVTAVPLPGSIWLFSSGLMGVLSFIRRKNKTASYLDAAKW